MPSDAQYQFPSYFSNVNSRVMRPVENVSFDYIRRVSINGQAGDGNVEEWPGNPYTGSFLDLLRSKTGIDFDLPSEAQWEFAARAGNGDTKWGDGSSIKNNSLDENLDKLGRHKNNGGLPANGDSDSENGTAIVGSYKPNDWGIYDMHGNVWEWCLDCFVDDIVDFEHNLEGPVILGENNTQRVVRGGGWNWLAHECRPARRFRVASSTTAGGGQIGFRLACKAGLD